MKILFTAARYHPNQHEWVRTLLEHGHEVIYLALYSGPSENHSALTPTILDCSLLCVILANLFGWNLENRKVLTNKGFPSLRQVWKLLCVEKPDIVLPRDINNFSIIIMFASRLLNIHTILYDQTPRCTPQKSYMRKIIVQAAMHILQRTPKRITPVQGQCKNYPVRPHTHYVPLAIRTHAEAVEHTSNPATPLKILCVSKFQKRKNILMVVRTIRRLRQQHDLRLTIVGTANDVTQQQYHAKVMRYIKNYNLQDVVSVHLNVPNERMYGVYQAHDLYILASTQELYGYSVLEAMANALPVICTDDAGAQYCVRDGVNGYVVPVNNSSAVSKAILHIANNRVLVEKFGANSLSIVRTEFSPETFYQAFSTLLQTQT